MRDAPWMLRGEVVVALRRRTVIVAARYDDSPVGPYLSFGVAYVGSLGLRPGLKFTTMVVDSHDRLVIGRRNWGFPGEVGTLTWARVGDECALVWHERGIEVRGRAHGGSFPVIAPARLLQHRADGPVVVPTRMRGRARRARVDVVAPPDDALARLSGEHRGVVIAGLAVQLRAARVPAGRVWSSRAAGAPESAT